MLAPAGAALLGAAVVIAAFGPKEGSPGLPTTPHLIAAGQGATQAPQSGETVAIRSDPDVTPLKVIPPVEFVGSEQRRRTFDAGSSPVPLSSTAPAGAAQPAPGVFAGLSVAAPVAADQSPPSQISGPNLVRTASTPPDPTVAPAATNAGEAAHQTDELQRPARPAPSSESKAATAARPTTLKLDSPAKLAGRTSPRTIVARTSLATSRETAVIRRQPLRPLAAASPGRPPGLRRLPHLRRPRRPLPSVRDQSIL